MVNVASNVKRELEYAGKMHEILYRLQGTEIFKAYWDLFPSPEFEPKAHYEILNDKSNRELMAALYKSKNPSIEQLAETTGLNVDDIGRRVEFFRANGMKKVKIREAA